MGDVVRAVSTIVFDGPEKKAQGLVHLVRTTDAVPSRNAVLVTTMCGMVGMGRVKLRRGANCGECLDSAGYSSTDLST